MNYAVCSIIPPHILAGVLHSNEAHQECRDSADHTLTQTRAIRASRHPGQHHGHEGHGPGHQGGPPGAQGIVPSYITQHVAKHDTDQGIRAAAQGTDDHDQGIRAARAESATTTATATKLTRKIYSCNGGTRLPGSLIRSEGQKPLGTRDRTRDPDECYDGFGDTYNFYKTILGRNSIDNKGLVMVGSVHYDRKYSNAMWDGTQMVFGDGDGTLFNGFTDELDVIGHELTHGVVQYTANLEYEGESGALNESMADVFGIQIKQWKLKQTAAQADWLIGEGILAKGVKGVALRSMKDPGSAYDDERLGGKDPQPGSYDNIVVTSDDNGGVHLNSGIPNKAFYLASVALGGHSWDQAGKIWYAALTDSKLSATANFHEFAALTVEKALELYDEGVKQKVVEAWAGVAIKLDGGAGNGGAGDGTGKPAPPAGDL